MYTSALLSSPLALLSLVSLSQASCLHATNYLPRRATAEGGVKVATFGYTGEKGPLNWHALAPENAICATGQNQSPINIDSTIADATETPQIEIPAITSAEFENLGSTIEVIANGTTTIGKTAFSLKQFHFHTPSEHRINEEYFPLEMHMVHQASDNSSGIAVLTILFELSSNDTTPLLTSLTSSVADIAKPGSVTTTGELDLTSIVDTLQAGDLYSYSGSLTTPPCAEGVTFYIAKTPLPIDVESFNAFKKVMGFNSRFSQGGVGKENLIALAAASAANASSSPEEATKEKAAEEQC